MWLFLSYSTHALISSCLGRFFDVKNHTFVAWGQQGAIPVGFEDYQVRGGGG